MLDVRKYLVHRAELVQYDETPATPDVWNRASNYTNTPTQVDCFVYFGSTELNLDTIVGVPRMLYSGPTKWQIVLPKQIYQSLHVKDRIQNIVRKKDAQTVRNDGYIGSFKIYEHPRHGEMFVLGVLEDGNDL